MTRHLEAILDAFSAGVGAVDPVALVRDAVRQGRLDPWPRDGQGMQVLALGKAAHRMVWGLVEAGIAAAGIGVTVKGTQAAGQAGFRWLAGEHPVPGPASLEAGAAVLEWARSRRGAQVLVLLSGGASACAEAPQRGDAQQELLDAHRQAASGTWPVEQANRHRSRLSAIKAGRLGRILVDQGCQVRCWVLQDAADVASVGSGPVHIPEVPHTVLATGQEVVAGAGLRLATRGYDVFAAPHRVSGRMQEEVERFIGQATRLEGTDPVLLGWGEPWQPVPPDAPPGGRCQHAALAAAQALADAGSHGVFCALATDGVDGTTREAGAWATAADADRPALESLRAHGHLDAHGRTIRTGPTGTNANDLWMCFPRA